MEFSIQQITAVEDAMNAFRRKVEPWVILLAQMQSGKTETFLLIACEMLRHKLINHIVIFSGNAETDLREQLKSQINNARSVFFRKYKKYLRAIIDDEDERDNIIDLSMERISVIWGCELNAYSRPSENTLFIWEEAHHAQSVKQRPDKFLRKIGISADGNADNMHENNNYMITISATPFSELSDNVRHVQGKHVVKMQPGDNYVGVKQIRDSGRIRSFRTIERGFEDALNLPTNGRKTYGIFRISHKNEEMAKAFIEKRGLRWVVYDSVSENRAERALGEATWKDMANEPAENTVILIRGKCRMGKNLEKKHLLFVLETARKSNTDTVLQSLLGRVCGYSDGSDRVTVFLSEKIVASGEINRYVELWEKDGVQVIPAKANNLTDRVKLHVPIVPIRVHIDRAKYPTNDRGTLLRCLKETFESRTCIVNHNTASAFEEVRRKVLNNESKYLNGNYTDARKEHQMERLRNIIQAHENPIARDFGTAGGIDSDGNEIKYWIPKNNVEEFDRDVMYVTAHVTREDVSDYFIPPTTRREVFAHRLEDGSEESCNGGMTIRLSSHTANDEAAMSSELCNMIEASIAIPGCDKKIASCWDYTASEFKGIIVTPEIYKKLQKDGSIYKYVFTAYGLKLHTCKSSGRVPKCLEERGYIKLSSISW